MKKYSLPFKGEKMYKISNCDGTHTGNIELVFEIIECYTDYVVGVKEELKNLEIGKKLNYWTPGLEDNIVIERIE